MQRAEVSASASATMICSVAPRAVWSAPHRSLAPPHHRLAADVRHTTAPVRSENELVEPPAASASDATDHPDLQWTA